MKTVYGLFVKSENLEIDVRKRPVCKGLKYLK